MSGPLNYAVQPYQQAVAVNQAAGLTAALPARITTYTISNINISGPSGTVNVYIGSVGPGGLVDSTKLGSSNTATYSTPLTVPYGQQVFVVWVGIHSGSAFAAFTCQSGALF